MTVHVLGIGKGVTEGGGGLKSQKSIDVIFESSPTQTTKMYA